MFDFEKLKVYQNIKSLNVKVLKFFNRSGGVDKYIIDQWKRASLSILLNLAEGTGRASANDKKHFYTIARGSLFECVAILDLLCEMNLLENDFYSEMYSGYAEASKMLLALCRKPINTL